MARRGSDIETKTKEPVSEGVLRKLVRSRIVPVVVLERVEDAVPLCDALIGGGLPVAEITFRTSAACEAISLIVRERPEMLVGAGTVLGTGQLAEAVDAGASFVVSPGLNPRVVDRAVAQGLPIVPGVNNPGQVEIALDSGLSLLKFFPAEPSGGTAMLKALNGPYREVSFLPTGGISPDNLREYLQLPNVCACGGSWMVPARLIAQREFTRISDLTRQAVGLAATCDRQAAD